MTSQYETSWSTHVNIVRLAQPIEGFVCKRFLPSPPPSFIFWLSFHFSRGQNRSFFAPKPNGNACYAGYWDLRKHFWLSSSTGDHCCAYQLTCIMTISTYTTGARAEMTRQPGFALWKSESLHPSCKWSQVLDESQTYLEVRHKWLDLLGMSISQRGRGGFPLGLELKKLQQILISAKKTAFLLRLVQDPARSKRPDFTSFYERSNSGYVIKPVKTKSKLYCLSFEFVSYKITCQDLSTNRKKGTPSK